MAQTEVTRLCARCEGSGRVPVSDRDAKIFEAYRSGSTLAEVGTKFGVSRQFVHQVVSSIDPSVLRGPAAVRRQEASA